jgi:hypothetical protein
MPELIEDHIRIRNPMPRRTKSAGEAGDDVITILRTYSK